MYAHGWACSNSWGVIGCMELQYVFNVSGLLGKLSHDLKTSFKRFIYPTRVAIAMLIDFDEWLEYELEVQENSVKCVSYKREESVGGKIIRDSKQASKTHQFS